jgi:hypothetical protein
MLRQPNAGVEKRAFRIAFSDPRRSVTCAAVRLQSRFTASVSRPLTVASAYHFPLAALQSDKVAPDRGAVPKCAESATARLKWERQ